MRRCRWAWPSDEAPEATPRPQGDEVASEAGLTTEVKVEADGVVGAPGSWAARRELEEEIARTSARAGWQLGRRGQFVTASTLRLRWTDDHELEIVGWDGERYPSLVEVARSAVIDFQSAAEARRADRVERLEAEIKEPELTTRRALPGSAIGRMVRGMVGDRSAEEELLLELRAKLRKLGPDSPWV